LPGFRENDKLLSMKSTLLSLLTFLLVSPAYGSEWRTSFGAEFETEALYWTGGTLFPDDKGVRGIYSAKAPTTIRRGRAFRIRALPSVQWDPANVSRKERFFWDMQEGFLQLQSLPWTVQLGMNVFAWGDTDVFNPLDVVNARRYFDPFRSEKLGAPAVMVKRDFRNFFAEAVYIPKQRKTLLPGENSRWMPRDVYRARSLGTAFGEARIILPSNMQYRYVSDVVVDNALDHNLALRLKFRFSGFDWTLAAYQGAAQAPDVRLREVTVSGQSILGNVATVEVDPDVGLQAGFYPVRMTGTSFVWVMGDFLVKGASAYTHVLNRRFDLPARYWENVLGLERTFGLGKGTLTALLQGTFVDRGDALDTNSVSLARMFDRAAMGALRWAPNESWTALLSYLRDTRFKGDLWVGEASYRLTDGWRAKLSGQMLNGPMETPLGTYRRNDRVTASLLAQF
jgi:hypothetical protein